MPIRFNSSFNVQRLTKKVLYTILALFVGGITLTYFVQAMNGTCSPFYNGLTFIGVTLGGANSSGNISTAGGSWAYCTTTSSLQQNTISSTGLSTSVLSVVGIISISAVLVTEFVSW